MMPFTREVTINRIACPLHVIELKKAFKTIANDEVLRVMTGSENVSHELISACRALGHELTGEVTGDQPALYLRKRSA